MYERANKGGELPVHDAHDADQVEPDEDRRGGDEEPEPHGSTEAATAEDGGEHYGQASRRRQHFQHVLSVFQVVRQNLKLVKGHRLLGLPVELVHAADRDRAQMHHRARLEGCVVAAHQRHAHRHKGDQQHERRQHVV